MTKKTSFHPAHDELLAQVRVTEQRLARFGDRLEQVDIDEREPFTWQADELLARCHALAEEIKDWTEVEVGIPTAVDDVGAAVDALEADFEAEVAGTGTDGEHYGTALDRQVRVWRGRIDRLRLQAMLGTMEAADEFDELVPRLDRARSTALVELSAAVEDSKDLAADVRRDLDSTLADARKNVEGVLSDVRKAVDRAAKTLVKPRS